MEQESEAGEGGEVITSERPKELREWLVNRLRIEYMARDKKEAQRYEDLLAILDDYERLRVEAERLNTWHCVISGAWRARAEKAEAELERLREEFDAARPLLEAANVAEVTKDAWGEMLIRAALAYRKKGEK
jgi:Xaa-Pro aminopeptidase